MMIFFPVQGSSSSNEWLPEPVASSFGEGGEGGGVGDSSDGNPLKSEMETQDGKFDEYWYINNRGYNSGASLVVGGGPGGHAPQKNIRIY